MSNRYVCICLILDHQGYVNIFGRPDVYDGLSSQPGRLFVRNLDMSKVFEKLTNMKHTYTLYCRNSHGSL